MAIDLSNLTAEVEVVYDHEDLITLKQETLMFMRLRANEVILSETFFIVQE